jgi:dienelactone hydrolase
MTKTISLAILVLVLCPGLVRAAIVTRTVQYTHDGEPLEGYLAYDDSLEGQRPGVLVVHEWWGLNDYARKRTRMLAELGYVAFAADMYGGGKTTRDPSEAGAWAGHLRGMYPCGVNGP